MGYYPIFLDVTDQPVLLVRGGHVALEKIGKLVDADADVTYLGGDTAGAFLVMVATDDGEVNRAVADEARTAGILVNAADDASNCDFILPSLVRRGELAIAASTGGTSPAMARWLRERLEDFLDDRGVGLGEVLADVRREVRERDRACAARTGSRRTPGRRQSTRSCST